MLSGVENQPLRLAPPSCGILAGTDGRPKGHHVEHLTAQQPQRVAPEARLLAGAGGGVVGDLCGAQGQVPGRLQGKMCRGKRLGPKCLGKVSLPQIEHASGLATFERIEQ